MVCRSVGESLNSKYEIFKLGEVVLLDLLVHPYIISISYLNLMFNDDDWWLILLLSVHHFWLFGFMILFLSLIELDRVLICTVEVVRCGSCSDFWLLLLLFVLMLKLNSISTLFDCSEAMNHYFCSTLNDR